MEIIILEDVQDDILKITQGDVDNANSFIVDMAARRGVAETEIVIGYMVKRLAIVYACYTRAVASVGTDVMANMDGNRGTDVYAQKAEFYKKELNTLSSSMTASDFNGGKRKGVASIPVYRS